MKFSEKIEPNVEPKASPSKGFGNVERPIEGQPQSPTKPPSAYRVETANNLALSTKAQVGELQNLVQGAIAAQNSTARETAAAIAALKNGSYLHYRIEQELEALEEPQKPVEVEFVTLSAAQLLGSAGRGLIAAGPEAA